MLVQQITPELLGWMRAQAQAGHTAEAVMQEMRNRGWNEAVARAAFEQLRRAPLDAPPPPVPVPGPDLAHWPNILCAGDRDVRVLAAMKLPRVVVFGDLLSHEECDELVELARVRLERSRVMDSWSGGNLVSDYRTSEGMFFERGENELLERIETRIAELVNWPADRGERLQVLRYPPGAEYRPHHDYFLPTVWGAAPNLDRGGQRVATLLIYLRSATKGGGTIFPEVGMEVAPVKGNALFFSYDRAHPMTLTLHAGAPVIEGEKWVATKWLREQAVA